MDDQVKRLVRENRQVGHVALDRLNRQPIPLGYETILIELLRRVIEHSYDRSRCRKQRPLLSATRGQAQCCSAPQRREPSKTSERAWSASIPIQTLAPSGLLNDFFCHRASPAILLPNSFVPGSPVVRKNVLGFHNDPRLPSCVPVPFIYPPMRLREASSSRTLLSGTQLMRPSTFDISSGEFPLRRSSRFFCSTHSLLW